MARGLRPRPEMEDAIAGILSLASQCHELAGRSDAPAHGADFPLVLGQKGSSSHLILATQGSRRRLDATGLCLLMAGQLHARATGIPVSWRVLAPPPVDGHALNVPCCQPIELQAAHSVTRAKFRQTARALGVWSDRVACSRQQSKYPQQGESVRRPCYRELPASPDVARCDWTFGPCSNSAARPSSSSA